MLARSKGFWISTVVFLLVSVGLIWFVLLPMMTSYRATTDEIASTTEQLESKKQFLATVQQLSNDQTSLETTFAAATAALPITTDPENLLIQLYALTKDLGLDATIIVPFDKSSTVGTQSTPPATSGDDVSPGPVSSSQPIVVSEPATGSKGAEFSITGEISFSQVNSLIRRLWSFSRWNKISSIDIANASDKMSVTVSSQVFSRPGVTESSFAGTDSELLSKARQLFGSLKQYSTVPDIEKEGNFGRTNPFATAD
ncbi:hypothetical protein A3A71_01225 [Candidatus Berkelbacteria bacterium RIFCSPLOWO2_01_FULL_50_28]|uniref:Uncharacterized protein n=1 Tax=Candidatus Berkelbacteria bacterium RIFCSPLOWO2_01_FULL_50_28 TaxID=1797471 RepID=A0A1F5EB73_9BACT|nr:MAG: hypothetical protein A2807_01795 [Candidatus Berkelbacteria bacterium RIFCSPHIGHO2_01_FULL_50_36]OGD63471.1 MAG: hypothetical protein A3F39_03235 [Candidatus Berkelbacteria bacterium RIFCSPHIGHO2_12_FULL_50_11]OGD64659.1 MAG: hypothetical protein A3A71_01225 [Candidatus Berkelbacteria bacterium RIFCSPLOWO2_01_FULL_50_28]